MKRRLLNPANALTLSRFLAAPVMLGIVLCLRAPGGTTSSWSLVALILLVATILTDLFDGMVARAYRIVTDFGKIMDPVADSTFFMTLLFGLAASPRFSLPIWIPMVVLWREVAMQVLRRYAALRGLVLAAKFSGKAKMAIQSTCMILFFLCLALSDLGVCRVREILLTRALLASGVLIAVVNDLSLFEYAREIPTLVREWHGEPDTVDHDSIA